MKAPEAVKRIREQRRALAVEKMYREFKVLEAQSREDDRKFKEKMARHESFNQQMSMFSQMACMPFGTPQHLENVKQQVERLCNEHGVRRDSPKPSLKVVGGSK